MIKKKENCEYCNEKMESKTAKKSFCSAKCRVYASRLKKILRDADIKADEKHYDLPSLPQNKPIKKVSNVTAINPTVWGRKPVELTLNRQENEPREGTMAFYNKYGVATYAELRNNS